MADDKKPDQDKKPAADDAAAGAPAAPPDGAGLIDTINTVLGEGGADGAAAAADGSSAPGEQPAAVETQPLVDALDVTPEHAQKLLDAAQQTEQYAGMSAQELADLLASDTDARADLERRVAAAQGAPEPTPEPAVSEIGDETDMGQAVWPGHPGQGKPRRPDAGVQDAGAAPWPGAPK